MIPSLINQLSVVDLISRDECNYIISKFYKLYISMHSERLAL